MMSPNTLDCGATRSCNRQPLSILAVCGAPVDSADAACLHYLQYTWQSVGGVHNHLNMQWSVNQQLQREELLHIVLVKDTKSTESRGGSVKLHRPDETSLVLDIFCYFSVEITRIRSSNTSVCFLLHCSSPSLSHNFHSSRGGCSSLCWIQIDFKCNKTSAVCLMLPSGLCGRLAKQ